MTEKVASTHLESVEVFKLCARLHFSEQRLQRNHSEAIPHTLRNLMHAARSFVYVRRSTWPPRRVVARGITYSWLGTIDVVHTPPEHCPSVRRPTVRPNATCEPSGGALIAVHVLTLHAIYLTTLPLIIISAVPL